MAIFWFCVKYLFREASFSVPLSVWSALVSLFNLGWMQPWKSWPAWWKKFTQKHGRRAHISTLQLFLQISRGLAIGKWHFCSELTEYFGHQNSKLSFINTDLRFRTCIPNFWISLWWLLQPLNCALWTSLLMCFQDYEPVCLKALVCIGSWNTALQLEIMLCSW